MDEVLFEVYDRAYERAYLERSSDKEIGAVLSHQGLWVTGPTGCGKTNALRRNLCRVGKPFEFIDLSKCIGASVPDLFAALHLEIAERLAVPLPRKQPPLKANRQSFHIGEIATLIERQIRDDTCLLIDEIPLDGADFVAFSEGVAALIVTLANRKIHKAPLLLASIADPTDNFKRFHKKVHERVRLLHMPQWPEVETNALLELISKLLPLHLSKPDKTRIVKAADGCPRSMKIMLKNWCMFRKTPGWSLDRVISESTAS
jgi:hypothetical protein